MVLPAIEYVTDAAQRWVLFWDVMRQRGNQYREHLAETAPHVLEFSVELVIDGRTLDPPVNYVLARVIPPKGTKIDPRRRPFVVVDPRAGHGPGIGGFKADSEIGVAFKAGHPCYFIGFLPDPMPGQTIEDIARAEAAFLEKVIALHPRRRWQALRDRQLSGGLGGHDAGGDPPRTVRPDDHRRVATFLLGRSSRAQSHALHRRPARRQLANGAHQRSRCTENSTALGWCRISRTSIRRTRSGPSNTISMPRSIPKPRAIWTSSDGGAVTSTSMPRKSSSSSIELFVGNNLAAGKIETSDGTALDLRNIRSPIVVFCSEGDNITPPPQALGWILDLYDASTTFAPMAKRSSIRFTRKIGHLGIFVSGGVARKEHGEFSSNIDLIDLLPPGLYEAMFERKGADTANPDLASGDWVMRCEERSLDDIRALGGNAPADDRCFAAAARISEINLALYRTFAQPFVRALATAPMARVDAEASSVAAQLRAVFRCQPDDGDASNR